MVPQGPSATRPLRLSGGGRGLLVVDIVLGALAYVAYIVLVVVAAATGAFNASASYHYGGTYGHYGTGGFEQQDAASTIEEYFAALGSDRGEAACSHLTRSFRQILVTQSGAADCPAFIRRSYEGLSPAERRQQSTIYVDPNDVTVTGSRATVTSPSGTTFVLRQVGGTWKIAAVN
jgi:hypothetical protein